MTFEQITQETIATSDRMGLPRYFKIIRINGRSSHQQVKWSLPSGDKPGNWMHAHGRLKMCSNGIHAARLCDIEVWMHHDIHRLYEIELDEAYMIHGSNKVASCRGRLVRRLRFDRSWVLDASTSYYDFIYNAREAAHGRMREPRVIHLRSAAAAIQLLAGTRTHGVNGMIEQLIAEQQLAAQEILA